MQIALLNLPFDNNYGGNLQRYALITVLQRMGHQVEHINLRISYTLPWYKKPYSYTKRLAKKLLIDSHTPIFLEKIRNRKAEHDNQLANRFYEQYIPHTRPAHSIVDIKAICSERKYNAYVVGSDQVWRKGMTGSIGLTNYFLEFTQEQPVKRLAYAVSTGTETVYDKRLVKKLSPLYKSFDAVSVREHSMLHTLETYGWTSPAASWVLDPTLLLQPSDYKNLIVHSGVSASVTSGKIFCYVLDMNSQISAIIKEKERSLGVESIQVGLGDAARVSIEQWLCNILNSEFVITDSFHGTVFSILFNKPFLFVGNERRGNARIDSLFRMMEIKNIDAIDWSFINKKIEEHRNDSYLFLRNNLS